jgi:hypothetical protein
MYTGRKLRRRELDRASVFLAYYQQVLASVAVVKIKSAVLSLINCKTLEEVNLLLLNI